MLIEIKELQLPKESDIFKRELYPDGAGLYLVSDGATFFIVSLLENSTIVLSIPVSLSEIETMKEAAHEKLDTIGKLNRKIEDLTNQLNQKSELSESVSYQPAQVESTTLLGYVSEDALLKAIAIVSKPELAKELL